MRKFIPLLLLAILPLPASASDSKPDPALAPDATLSKQIVGLWQATYHQYLYKANGTWVRDPDTSLSKTGTWSIKDGHITRHWTKSGKSETTQILKLTDKTLEETAEGVLFVERRIQQ